MNTLDINGHTFTLKGYTRNTEREFKEKAPKIEARLEAGEIDRFQYYYELLSIIADGPIEQVNPDDMEGRVMEEFVMSFLPPSMRLYGALTAFSR